MASRGNSRRCSVIRGERIVGESASSRILRSCSNCCGCRTIHRSSAGFCSCLFRDAARPTDIGNLYYLPLLKSINHAQFWDDLKKNLIYVKLISFLRQIHYLQNAPFFLLTMAHRIIIMVIVNVFHLLKRVFLRK